MQLKKETIYFQEFISYIRRLRCVTITLWRRNPGQVEETTSLDITDILPRLIY
jgi:hypothetical protein